MLIPSIDLMGGKTVQLVGGKEMAIDAGDPRPIAEQFRLAGEVAVIDLDAAMSQGSNKELILDLLATAPCRVGGGIRDVETAIQWLDAGAAKVILGTRAVPEILSQLPKERVIAAVDAYQGEVVVEGWKTKTGATLLDQVSALKDYVGGFLVTFVEREGRMEGIDLEQVKAVVDAAGDARVTIAGGVTTAEDIAALDALGADAQVGMALYSKKLDLGDAIVAPLLKKDSEGLWPTVVVDERGVALGLTWSNRESVQEAVNRKQGVYHSRSRGLWIKGETSGATQELLNISLDCDRDALRFTVRQAGSGFCHLNTRTCWGNEQSIGSLMRLIESRVEEAPEGSYTKRLLNDAELLKSKLEEEATELAAAEAKAEVAWEAADLLYFTMVRLVSSGVSLEEVEAELSRRMGKVTRRAGDAKN